MIGELLGHVPPYTTTLIYFHALPDAKRDAIESLTNRHKNRHKARNGDDGTTENK